MPTEWTTAILNWNGLQGTLLEGGYEVEECFSRNDASAAFILRILGDRFTKATVRFFAPGGVSPEQFLIWTEACQFPPAGLSKPMGVGQIRFEGQSLQYVMFVQADETVADVLGERALTAPEVREITQTAVAALGGLHSRGYVHACLAPQTILAVGQTVVLSTVGLRRIQHPVPARNEETSMVPRYAAPESKGENGTPEADIWCLGASIFEALTQQPYTTDDMAAAYALPSPFNVIAVCSLDEDPHARCSLSAIRAMLRGEQLDLLEQRKAAAAAKAAVVAKAEAAIKAEAAARAEAAAEAEAIPKSEAAATAQAEPEVAAKAPAQLAIPHGATPSTADVPTPPLLTRAAAAAASAPGSSSLAAHSTPAAPALGHVAATPSNGGKPAQQPIALAQTAVTPESLANGRTPGEPARGGEKDSSEGGTASTAAVPAADSSEGSGKDKGAPSSGKGVPSLSASVAAIAAAAASAGTPRTASGEGRTARSSSVSGGSSATERTRPRSAMPLPHAGAPLWTDAVRFPSPEELAAEMTAKRARIRIVSYVIAALALIGCVFWLIFAKPGSDSGSKLAAGGTTASSQLPAPGKQSWPARELGPGTTTAPTTTADGSPKGADSLPPSTAGTANSPLLSDTADGTGSGNWRVIAYTANKLPDAQRRAQQIAAKHPGFSPEVFSPSGNGAPYLVVLGGRLDRDRALKVKGRARARGLARDAYVQNFSR